MTEVEQTKVALWARVVMGLTCLMVLAMTVPAFFNATLNPALASLPPDLAALGSVAGGFLARQFAIAIVGLYAAWKASPAMLMVAGAAVGIWNLLEGVFQLSAGGVQGGLAGLLIAGLALSVIWAAVRAKNS